MAAAVGLSKSQVPLSGAAASFSPVALDPVLFLNHFGAFAAARTQKAKVAARKVPESRLRSVPIEDLAESAYRKFLVEPVELHASEVYATRRQVTLDRSRYRSIPQAPGDPSTIEGTEVTIHIPFAGTPELFELRPNQADSNPPRGYLSADGSEICFTVEIPRHQEHEATAIIEGRRAKTLSSIERYVKNQEHLVNQLNTQVQQEVQSTLATRLRSLTTVESSLEALGLKRRGGSPSLPIQLDRKISLERAKEVTGRTSTSVENYRTLKSKDYEDMLSLIRHQCRTFEGSPTAFGKLDEPELRDIIKASLNAVYSAVAGEAFRNHGKTDILIEVGDRSAFVAECKLWNGESKLLEAIDQLVGYLTWRDEKTALVIFNKQAKDFAALRNKILPAVQRHGLYKKTLREDTGSGEWRVVFGTDSGTDVACQVMIYHLGTDE